MKWTSSSEILQGKKVPIRVVDASVRVAKKRCGVFCMKTAQGIKICRSILLRSGEEASDAVIHAIEDVDGGYKVLFESIDYGIGIDEVGMNEHIVMVQTGETEG